MKIWTSILVAGAILAFAAPAGFSAATNVPSDPQTGPTHPSKPATDPPRVSTQAATIKALRAENKALAAKLKALTAANKALEARLNASSRSAAAGGCSGYTFCTHENDCLYWGVNCSGATAPATTEALDYTVLACASSADPVQTIDYPESYDWSC